MADEAHVDLDPEIVEALAQLEATQNRAHRVLRRPIIVLTSGIGALTLAHLLATWVGRGPWVVRDMLQIVGLGFLGLVACWGQVVLYRMLVQRDGEVLESHRQKARMAAAIDDLRPLMAAIRDAHSRGIALVIPPLDPEGRPNSPFAKTDDRTVH
jgi:hypothetical protein